MNQKAFIDVGHLDKYVAGDRALRDEILAIFEEQAELWTRMLDPRADDTAWTDAAHALKGASRGVGAWTIGDICATAEHLVGSDADPARREKAVSDLRAAVRSTIAEVRRLRAF
jgi:HPt (histidine-containing phosphotransfer) domain-containing protein